MTRREEGEGKSDKESGRREEGGQRREEEKVVYSTCALFYDKSATRERERER